MGLLARGAHRAGPIDPPRAQALPAGGPPHPGCAATVINQSERRTLAVSRDSSASVLTANNHVLDPAGVPSWELSGKAARSSRSNVQGRVFVPEAQRETDSQGESARDTRIRERLQNIQRAENTVSAHTP